MIEANTAIVQHLTQVCSLKWWVVSAMLHVSQPGQQKHEEEAAHGDFIVTATTLEFIRVLIKPLYFSVIILTGPLRLAVVLDFPRLCLWVLRSMVDYSRLLWIRTLLVLSEDSPTSSTVCEIDSWSDSSFWKVLSTKEDSDGMLHLHVPANATKCCLGYPRCSSMFWEWHGPQCYFSKATHGR